MPRPKGPQRRRVQVTLSEESWAMVERISEILEEPKAALLAEMFEATLPAMVNTVEALHLAKQGLPREAQRIITNFGSEAVMKLQQANLEFDATITEHEKSSKKKKPGGRRPRRGAS